VRRIVARHIMIDTDGFAWDVAITIPHDEYPPHGPAGPVICFETPDDPKHPLYGEDAPEFELTYLETVIAMAKAATL
jgi:hypothetical protein